VKRRSRINFSFAPNWIERLKATPEFHEIATSPFTPIQQDPLSLVQFLYVVLMVQPVHPCWDTSGSP
jgi:hypothetical protein